MIVTVTPNPSLDRTLHIQALTRGAVHRAGGSTVEPSGKGVNVALAVHATGAEVVAVLPAGGDSGDQLAALLARTGLRHQLVPIRGDVRTNVSVVEPDGTTTKLNEPGPALHADEIAALFDAALRASRPGDWVAWCGSLPPGFAPSELVRLVAATRAAGRRVALDTSGEALDLALAAPPGQVPQLIKPNSEELAGLAGRSLRTLGDVVDAARAVAERGIDTVLVSLGGDGAVLVTPDVVLHGQVRVDRVVNTAGAGDAFLAGYLAGDLATGAHRPGTGPIATETVAGWLARALQFGAAAVSHDGTLFRLPDRPRAATIGPPDRDQPLREPVPNP